MAEESKKKSFWDFEMRATKGATIMDWLMWSGITRATDSMFDNAEGRGLIGGVANALDNVGESVAKMFPESKKDDDK